MIQENEALIAYCGLYCGECFNYQGKIADLARDLRKELRTARFDTVAQGLSKYFKDFKDYDTCYRVLGAMVRLRCKRSCRDGGGNPMCKIRTCCQNKGLTGCWQCLEFESCTRLDFLKPVHKDAHLKNLRKLEKAGVNGFLNGAKYF